MIALSLSLIIFLSLGVVGIAVLAMLAPRRNRLQIMLLAPVVGLAATVLPLFTLSRAGLAIGSFAVFLAAALLLASVAVFIRTRLALPWRRYTALLAVFVVVLLEIGRPALRYGFDWVSYANDDMATEVLYASSLVDAGFSDTPNSSALLEGRDYTQMGWIAHHVRHERPAGRMVLAWLSSVTGLTIHQVYMPLMLALHLTLASTAAALVTHSRRQIWAPLLTASLVGFSALLTSATLNQLLGQTGGIALLAGATALIITPFERRARKVIRQGVLFALVASTLFLWYPESMPFLVVAAGMFVAISLVRRRLRLRPLVAVVVVAVVSGVVALNTYLPVAVTFMLSQTGGSHALGEDELAAALRIMFPTYLMPSGLANLWGMQVIGDLPIEEPWQSGTITVGAMLLAGAMASTIILAWRRHPAAIMALTMTVVCIPLVVQQSGFALFKLAMFLQPFVLGTMVVAWQGLTRMRAMRPALAWQLAPPILLGLAGSTAHLTYVAQSYGYSTATHLPGGSEVRIVDQFRQALAGVPPGPVMLDTMTIVLAKFQAAYTVGRPADFPSSYLFFEPIYRLCTTDDPLVDEANAVIASPRAKQIQVVACSPGYDSAFSLLDSAVAPSVNRFKINWIGRPEASDVCPTLIAASGRQTIFNKRFGDDDGPAFKTYPCNSTNHLIFVTSQRSRHYYGAGTGETGVFAVEQEPLWRSGMMVGLGRYLLFQVIRPTEAPRLMLDLTASYKGDGENLLPPASTIGDTRELFPTIGRGSARVFSPPVAPQMISGDPYIGIDMGVDGQYFPERRTGLASLYGTELRIDSRRMTGFARAITLVSEEEYRRLAPPSVLSDFRTDLANPDLEYSGTYEDGWVSEASFYGLTQPSTRSTVTVEGAVPQIDDPTFSTELRLLVDGQEIARQMLKPGAFEIRGPAPLGEGRRRVELRFSNVQRLGAPDNRPVAAELKLVGIEAASGAAPPSSVRGQAADLEGPALAASGLYRDGWIAERSFITLTQPVAPAEVVVRGQVPHIDDPAFQTELTVLIDGQEAARKTIGVGDFELRTPTPDAAGERRVELRFSATQTLPAPDGRAVGAQMQTVGFEAARSAVSAPPVPPAPVAAASSPVPVLAQAPSVTATPVPTALEMAPLQAVTDPHTDLGNPVLQATGLDGDGWLAGTSSFTLAQPGTPSTLAVRGMVPLVANPAFSTELQVLVDGQEVGRQTLGLGEFELRTPALAGGAGQRRVELRFSATQLLPAPDSRQVSARVTFAGFEVGATAAQAADPAPTAIPTQAGPEALRAITDPHTDLGNPVLQATGLDGDGWLAGTSSFTLAQPSTSSTLVVRGMVPLVADPGYSSELQILLDGQEVARQTLGLGDFELRVPAPAGGEGQRRVELRFSTTQQLPAPDTRQVGARIQLAGFVGD